MLAPYANGVHSRLTKVQTISLPSQPSASLDCRLVLLTLHSLMASATMPTFSLFIQILTIQRMHETNKAVQQTASSTQLRRRHWKTCAQCPHAAFSFCASCESAGGISCTVPSCMSISCQVRQVERSQSTVYGIMVMAGTQRRRCPSAMMQKQAEGCAHAQCCPECLPAFNNHPCHCRPPDWRPSSTASKTWHSGLPAS